MFTMLVLITLSIVRLIGIGNSQVSFLDVALSIFLITQFFNFVDLLLIDWLVVETIQPSFLRFPGTEHLAGYWGYGFHFRGFLKGVLGSLIASLVIAGITLGVMKFLGG